MESKRVFVTPGRIRVNVLRMKKANALTNMMMLIETVQRAEVVVVAQDQVGPTVQRKVRARKEREKAKEAREINLLPPRTVDQSHVACT